MSSTARIRALAAGTALAAAAALPPAVATATGKVAKVKAED